VDSFFSAEEIAKISGGRKPPAPKDYRLPEVFPSLSEAKRIAFDLESIDHSLAEDKGPGWRRGAYIVGFSLAIGDTKGGIEFAEYYPLRHQNAPNLNAERVWDWVSTELAFYQGEIVGTNLLYDFDGLQETQDIIAPSAKFRDIQYAEPLLDENAFSYSLNTLAQQYLGTGKVTDELRRLYGDKYIERFHEIHPGHARAYGLGDVTLPLQILEHQRKALHKEKLEAVFDLECRLIPMLLYMRRIGQRVDIASADSLRDKLFERRAECLAQASKAISRELTVENFGKSTFLVAILKSLGIECPRTTLGNPSISDEWLKDLKHPFGPLLAKANQYDKALETFVNGYITDHQINGRIHCEFHPLRRISSAGKSNGTVSGRFASSSPNLQNIPVRDKEIGPLCRAMFIPEEGMQFFSGDFSQLEYREIVHAAVVRAQMPKDQAVKMWGSEGVDIWTRLQSAFEAQKAYINDPTTDFHQMMANMTGLKRADAKCLDGDTLVSSKKGLYTIKTLIGNSSPNQHKTIEETELADGKGNFITSTQGIVREKVPCVYVMTRQAIVCCSREHRWQTEKGLVAASELKEGTQVPLATVPALVGTPQTVAVNLFDQSIGAGAAQMLLDEKWAYLAGIFHGDGTSNQSSLSITHGGGDDYESWRETIRQAARAVGIEPRTNKSRTATYLGSRAANSIFAQLHLIHDKTTCARKNLRIPWWVLTGGRKVALAYLAGLIDTDGTIGKTTNLSITTHSLDYCGQLLILMRALGYQVFAGRSWCKAYQRYYYKAHVAAVDLKRLAQELPLQTEKRQQLVQRSETVKKARRVISDNIQMVVDAGTRTVYDFHVDTADHLYLQGGLIGHNSVNFAVAFVMGLQSFAETLGWLNPDGTPSQRAIDTLKKYHERVPFVKAVGTAMTREADDLGYTESLLGRRAHYNRWEPKFREDGKHNKALPLVEAKDVYKGQKLARAMTYAALNRFTQMGGGDIIKTAMVRAFESGLLDAPSELIVSLTVHDELDGSVAPTPHGQERLTELKNIMEHAVPLMLPTVTEFCTGKNWAETH
jgi:DNA polymerase I-like protein with 3'-5' exonuclease and polymerase domains